MEGGQKDLAHVLKEQEKRMTPLHSSAVRYYWGEILRGVQQCHKV